MPAEKFIGGVDGGVPKNIFGGERTNGFIKGRSGNPLYVDISKSVVRIWDMIWNCHFIASVESGVLSIDVWTKGYKGANQKHPDLYFNELLIQSMERFEREKVEINAVACDWENDWEAARTSDLYWEFMSGIGDEPTRDEMVQAAKNTSAGKVLAKFGFENVTEVEIRKFAGKEKVVAIFAKEPENEPVAV